MDFEELFEAHFDAIYGYAARRVGPELGRDLAAETFTRAYAARKRFDRRRAEPRAWLFGIANNLLRRHYRDEERRLRAFARVDFQRDEAAALEESSIAEALSLPVGTVRSRLNRARTRLREEWTKEAVNG